MPNPAISDQGIKPAARALAQRILRHSPLAAANILTAVTRGINGSIGEGLLIESEQFARMAPTFDLREGLDAWLARRAPSYAGAWSRAAAAE